MSKGPAVLTEIVDGNIGVITINRRERMNAWDDKVQEGMYEALNTMECNLDIRAVIITGSGRFFCAGADIQMTSDGAAFDDNAGVIKTKAKSCRITTYAHLRKMRCVTISAINGAAAGLGMSFAFASDFRFAARDAKIAAIFPQRGLVCEQGSGFLLPMLSGYGNSLEFFYEGSPVAAGDLPPGTIQKCFDFKDLMPETLAFAKKLVATCSPTSMAVIKAQVMKLPRLHPDEAAAIVDNLMQSSYVEENPDGAEAKTAARKGQAPRFSVFDESRPVARRARAFLDMDWEGELSRGPRYQRQEAAVDLVFDEDEFGPTILSN